MGFSLMRHYHFSNLHVGPLLIRLIPLLAAGWWLWYTPSGKAFRKSYGGAFWTILLSVAFAWFILWSVGTLAGWMHAAQSPEDAPVEVAPSSP